MLKPRRHSKLSRLYSLSRGRGKYYAYPLRKRFYSGVEEVEEIVQEYEAELAEALEKTLDEKLGEYVEYFEELNEKVEEELKQMSRRAKYSRYNRRRLYAEQDDEVGGSQKNPELEELDKLLKELDMRVGKPDESSNSGVIYKALRNFANYILEAGKNAFEDMLKQLGEMGIGLGFLSLAVGIAYGIFALGGVSFWLASLIIIGIFLACIILVSTIILVAGFFYHIAVQVKVLREVRDLALQAISTKEAKERKKIMQQIKNREETYKTAVNEAIAKLQEKLASK